MYVCMYLYSETPKVFRTKIISSYIEFNILIITGCVLVV